MKFGKLLETEELERFRNCYIQYKELKKALKVFAGHERDQATVQEVTHWTSSFLRLGPNPEVPPEAKLNDILETELKRVSKIVSLQEDDLRSQLARLSEEAAKPGGDRAAMWKSLEDLGEQIVQLKSFEKLNFTGFRKILKKYDKWSKSAVLAWFMGQVMRAPLMSVDYESLLSLLNGIAMALAEPPAAGRPAAPAAAGVAANEMALLVLPKDTMWFRVQLALHMQLVPQPAAGPAQAGAAAAAAPRPQKPRTSSYFFDKADFSVYAAYVAGAPGEESIEGGSKVKLPPQLPCGLMCLRDEGGESVSLVRTAFGSMQMTEVPLSRRDASQLTKGGFVQTPRGAKADGGAPAGAVLGDFRVAMAGGLRVVAQASSRRSEFRDRGGPMTASLQEDIKMAPGQEWGAPPSSTEFLPYNVLHVSCAPDEPPKWLRSVYDSPQAMEVSGFSLALHAVARCCLRESKLPMPHWYRSVMDCRAFADDEEKQSDSRPSDTKMEGQLEEGGKPRAKLQPPKEDQPLERTRLRSTSSLRAAGGSTGGARLLHEFGPESMPAENPDAASAPAADSGSLASPLLVQPGKLPVREAIVTVQPKTLYSNERTFLEWIHFATIFAVLGLGLMHGAPRASGVAIGRGLVVLAIFLVLWSLSTFGWRSDALDRKEIRSYHDPVGPPVLVCGVLSALALACLHAVKAI